MTLAPRPAGGVRRWWVPLLLASTLGPAGLLAAPPYFGADAASAGLRHVSMGHRWRWAPPSADEVCRALLRQAQPAPRAPALECSPARSRRSDMVVRVNRVRLASEVTVLLAAGLAGIWLRRL